MSVKYHQVSLKESFSICQDILIDDTPSFFQLLEDYFDISDLFRLSFIMLFTSRLIENSFIRLRSSSLL